MHSSKSRSAFKRSLREPSRPPNPGAPVHALAALVAVLILVSPARGTGASEDAPPRLSSPPIHEHYVQYGVGFTSETVSSAGAICPRNADAPCILGSGIGLALRAGYRSRGHWYFGGSYESSRQDPSNLLRLAILQQLRADARYYIQRRTRLSPYLTASLGGAIYGNEWGAETGGLVAFAGVGMEAEVSRTSVVGATLGYRPLVFRRWRDSAGQLRADQFFGFGTAHLIALEVMFELRDPRPRW